MIKPEEIKPKNGWVLFKPDPHYETFQLAGVETNIQSANYSYTTHKGQRRMIDVKERNYSTRGTVYAVTEQLLAPDDSYHKMDRGVITQGKNAGMAYNQTAATRFREVSEKVNLYDTDVEVLPGDRVFVSWRVHGVSEEIETTDGTMIFIKYDQIIMTLGDDDKPKKMVNGCVLLEKVMSGDIKNDGDGVDYKTTESGLYLPVMKEKAHEVVKKRNNLCRCILAGLPVRGYKDFPDSKEEEYSIDNGELMWVQSNGIRALEQMNHREYKERYFYTRRRFITFTEKTAEMQGIEFNKLME